MTTGYPRYPTIHGDTIVFVAEDDLWRVPADGGTASRITAGLAAASRPLVSPDGTTIAYTGAEEGPSEVHVVPLDGGRSRRLTHEGTMWCRVTGWSADGTMVRYSTSAGSGSMDFTIREVPVAGGESRSLSLGRATALAQGPGGVTVLAREYFGEQAHWKRYRGGTAGQLWIDSAGDGQYRRLVDLDGNLSSPCVVGDRVFFLSDHEGHGNVYSTNFDGGDLRRHSDHQDFYARSLSTDGTRLVYHSGGRLYLVDPDVDEPRRLDVRIPVTRTQLARRFVDAAEYLESARLTPDGGALAVISRGKAFTLANWEGAVTQHGAADGVRYEMLTWLHGTDRLVAVASDDGPAESLVLFDAEGGTETRLSGLDLGRVNELVASPTADRIAVTNHRNELVLVDLSGDTPDTTVLDTGANGIGDLAFSPDGAWLAYAAAGSLYEEDSPARSELRLVELATGTVTTVVPRILTDHSPAFDPDGKYLYFLGVRELEPVYDSLHFDLNFPLGLRPYAVTLRADVPPPFLPQPAPLVPPEPGGKSGSEDTDGDGKDSESAFGIDLDGIQHRVVPAPLGLGRYSRLLAAKGKLLALSEPLEAEVQALDNSRHVHGMLDAVDLATGKVERFADGVSNAEVTADGQSLLYVSDRQLRVVKTIGKAPESVEFNRESGWIDLNRIRVSVRPELEWPQMFRQAWRLLAENYWTADMAGIDWAAIHDRYAPLLSRLSTRGELSDLIWEMNGELGTSHVYERMGDYRPSPYFHQGFLGAEFTALDDGYRIDTVLAGDPGNPEASSPLLRPGVDVRVGDVITAVNGQPVGGTTSVAERLVDQAGREVRLTVRRGDEAPRNISVACLISETPLRYREWVEANRARVTEATDGRVGYVHIPDMGPRGFAEFHRSYLNAYDRDGLIIDVRGNGGGHVSGLLLEKLARRRVGYAHSRWGHPSPYPRESPAGPMVALTDEMAGSDGDIFSNGFRQLGLGPLIGTRTWGGVVGYFPWRPKLSDGTFLSQPEVAFHFDDTQWGVENHGVDPDIVVDYRPQDYAAGHDPQLAKAIEVVLARVAEQPPHRPVASPRPRLAAPPLPPRPQA